MARLWRTWCVLVLFAAGTSLITPLIPLYQEELGFNDTVVTLFLGCYVATLVPSMLTLGQLSDQAGRRPVLLGAILLLAAAQGLLLTEPDLGGLLVARAMQGLAMGAFAGTCTAFLVDAAPRGRRGFAATLASVSIRLGLGLGPGLGGVLAEHAARPLRLPFAVHLVALAAALVLLATLPETVRVRRWRRMSLRLEVPPAERSVFWRVLVPSGMIFGLFDGVALSLIPVFLVDTLGVTNYALVGASGFLVLVAGALSPLLVPRLVPARAIALGLAGAALSSFGMVAGAPTGSAALVLSAVALTGAFCGLVLKGGVDLVTQIAPPADRGKVISAYYVACWLGGFSVPLIAVGALSDLLGLTPALGILSVSASLAALWTWAVGLRSLHRLVPPEERALPPMAAG